MPSPYATDADGEPIPAPVQQADALDALRDADTLSAVGADALSAIRASY